MGEHRDRAHQREHPSPEQKASLLACPESRQLIPYRKGKFCEAHHIVKTEITVNQSSEQDGRSSAEEEGENTQANLGRDQ